MWIRWLAIGSLGLLTLHSLAYGGGFVTDPEGMAQEFGANEPGSEAASNLTGLVGVLLVLLGVFAGWTIWLLMRGHPQAAWNLVGMATVTLAIGMYWATRGNSWDAGFYSLAAVVLGVPGFWLLRATQMAPKEP